MKVEELIKNQVGTKENDEESLALRLRNFSSNNEGHAILFLTIKEKKL